ncbi:hypothetical protein [Oceanibium sediminis]|uniref:hypothetical protein n=1 Tax=Oceanibium sediminis TaxID=2026339 RepID=UPI000DD4129F|nr:hypothetical protein [Oceanibium sediminis]
MTRYAALALTLMATPLAAEEAGTITLETGGETVEFTLWAAQSDWSGSESYASFNIYSRPVDRDATDLSLFTLGGEVAGGKGSNPEIRMTRVEGDTRTNLFGEDDDTGLEVTVDSFTVEGEFLSLSGSFTGKVGPSDNYGRDIIMDAAEDVSGTFTVTLGPVE